MSKSPFEPADEALLEHVVRASREDLPDEARFRRLQRALVPVFKAGASSARWWLRPHLWVAAVAITATFAGLTRGTDASWRSEAATKTSSPSPARPPSSPSSLSPVDSVTVAPAAPLQGMPVLSVDALVTAPFKAKPTSDVKRSATKPRGESQSQVPAAEETYTPESPADELALLEAARQSLGSDPTRTLSLLDDHVKRFQRPYFAEERERLAIDALVRLNRRADAGQRARLFEVTYPDSPHRARVRALLAPRVVPSSSEKAQ